MNTHYTRWYAVTGIIRARLVHTRQKRGPEKSRDSRPVQLSQCNVNNALAFVGILEF